MGDVPDGATALRRWLLRVEPQPHDQAVFLRDDTDRGGWWQTVIAAVRFICLLGCGMLLMILPAVGETCPIPLEKGTQWVYEGKVRWTEENSAAVKSARIRWVCEVVEHYGTPTAQAAVIRGFPDELCWYEPGQAPRFSVLLSVSNKVYQLPASGEEQARALARRLTHSRNPMHGAEAFLELPLAAGRQWGQEPRRTDTLYGWYVEKAETKTLAVKGFAKAGPAVAYRLAYRTGPDHQIFEIVPELGIISFVYDHHGTVASTDVALVSFSKPPDSKPQPKSPH